jgi:UDP-N-acetylmuramoylalanine-D-glutamate ligase
MAQLTGLQAMRAANATVEPLRIEEIPAQLLDDLPPVAAAAFTKSDGTVTFSELRQALTQYRDAAHRTDLAMQQAETQADATAMASIAARERASRDAFYIPGGLLENSYYHTIDRLYTSFPEIVFAGADDAAAKSAYDRILQAVRNATAALTSTASP